MVVVVVVIVVGVVEVVVVVVVVLVVVVGVVVVVVVVVVAVVVVVVVVLVVVVEVVIVVVAVGVVVVAMVVLGQPRDTDMQNGPLLLWCCLGTPQHRCAYKTVPTTQQQCQSGPDPDVTCNMVHFCIAGVAVAVLVVAPPRRDMQHGPLLHCWS